MMLTNAFMEVAVPKAANPGQHTRPEDQVSWREVEDRLDRRAEAARRVRERGRR